MSGSVAGQKKINWKGRGSPPVYHLFLCMLEQWTRQSLTKDPSRGRAAKWALTQFKEKVPYYNDLFPPNGASDAAILGRADTQHRFDVKGDQKSYASENPEVNPVTMPHWSLSETICFDGKIYSNEELVGLADSIEGGKVPQIEVTQTTVDNEKGKFLYVNGNGSDCCNFGHSKDPDERLKAFAKGCLGSDLQTHQLWIAEEAAKLESFIKKGLTQWGLHDKYERYAITPVTMTALVEAIARANGYLIQRVTGMKKKNDNH